MARLDPQWFIDWADDKIVNHSRRVILLFVVLTAIFGAGLSAVETESGTDQFAEEVPEEEAFTRISEEFTPRFQEGTGSTQLIQRAPNVLSRRELLRMLEAQKRLADRADLRVTQTASAASVVAQTLDPDAETLDAQVRAMERATDAEVAAAVRENAENPRFVGLLADDFNPTEPRATATIGVITHSIPLADESGAGQGGDSPLTPIQQKATRIVATVGGDISVFGSGVIADEFGTVITDSLIIVVPAAVLFIVLFLVVAYRDLVDLMLGTLALGMALVWTFGFLGLAGIPFNQIMIAVPPLLLAVGIDFGIHAVNRYREVRTEGYDVGEAMRKATDQLLVAFFIVTGTTVIGFLSNLVSNLTPIRDFGVVAAIGIVFTFFVFGVFLPAAKVEVDRLRQRYPIPTFSQAPLGREGSSLGTVLRIGVRPALRAPAVVLVVALILSGSAMWYATGVDTEFGQEDFLPPSEAPAYLKALPEPFAPGDYSVVADIEFLEERFSSSQSGVVTVFLEGRSTDDAFLQELDRVAQDPPETFITVDRRADSTSILTVIRDEAEQNDEFASVVARHDRDGDGIPDRDIVEVYDALFATDSADRAAEYISEDYASSRVDYRVKADADDDAVVADTREMADRFRTEGTATGAVVVFSAISDLILDSAVQSLIISMLGTGLFLIFIYWWLEGRPSLALANLVPILVAVTFVAGTMRLSGISFNAFTATVLALTIGLGVDYSVHIVHRFIDERVEHDLETALDRTVRGTGGALAGSMLTTVFGLGVLVLAVLSILGQFGLLTAASIVYSFLASVLVLPSALVLWDRFSGNDPVVPLGGTDIDTGASATAD
ncbi:MMPL family transporter [Haloferax sp. MBLA0076]|uniref:MMPL family transporter n=1 Tax=Haloferax litoreum TaxID=2666140 RepID=A0A6A8GIF8_9EURY|nr:MULTISPECIES: efflux RND transporter permease subunit [Haloferax]KAB1194372.1 MMPL family transporter [Haloferax sp. CBA1148]MRX22935.1 MMPL family transporter [Haloferax litoreum]